MQEVTIAICTYNRCQSLKRAMQSVLKASYPKITLLIVDNNSSDQTSQIVQELQQAYLTKKIEYYFEPQQGVAAARNRALKECRTEYLGFIDDDEEIIENWVESMLTAFELDSKVGVVTGPGVPIYEVEPPTWMSVGVHDSYLLYPEKTYILPLNTGIGTGNVLMRAECFANIYFREDLGRQGACLLGAEDTDFFRRVLAQGYLPAYAHRAIMYHHINKEKLTFSWFARRYFYEGVSEYVQKQSKKLWLKRLFTLIVQSFLWVFTLLTFNSQKIYYRGLRVIQLWGIICGPWIK